MPRIPVRTRQVQTAALPGVRVGLQITPQDVTGGVEKGLAAGGEALYARDQRETERARTTRLLDAHAELGQVALGIQSRIKGLQGKDAVSRDLEAEATQQLEQAHEKIAKELPDEEMRQDFKRNYLQEVQSVRSTAASHLLQQGEKVREGAYKGAVDVAQSKAALSFDQPEEVKKQRGVIEQAVAVRRSQDGWEDDFAESERLKHVSGLYKKVIEQIQAKSPYAASLYLDDHAKEMDGGVVADLRKTLAPGALVDQATTKVKEIEAQFPGKPEEQSKAVLALQGELGGKALDVWKEREGVRTHAVTEEQRGIHGRVLDAIEKNEVRTRAELEAHPDFGKLTDENRPKARQYLQQQDAQRRAEARANRLQSTEDRRAQQNADNLARTEFDAIVQTDLEAATKLDVRDRYAGTVSKPMLNVLIANQGKAAKEWNKDRGVGASEFARTIESEARGMPFIKSKTDMDELKGWIGRKRTDWLAEPENEKKTKVPREVLAGWIAESMEMLDKNWSLSDLPRFKMPEDEQDRPRATKQPYLERRSEKGKPAAPKEQQAPPLGATDAAYEDGRGSHDPLVAEARAAARAEAEAGAAPPVPPLIARPAEQSPDEKRVQAAWTKRFPNRPPLSATEVQRVLQSERAGGK